MIGALASFGVLDPSKFLPQRCQFGELNCENFALASDETSTQGDFTNASVVYFQLLNGMADSMTVSEVSWRDSNHPTWVECAFANYTSAGTNDGNIETGTPTSQTISRDEKGDFICAGEDNNAGNSMAFEEGKREKIEIRFQYNVGTTADARYAKYLYGEISANAR